MRLTTLASIAVLAVSSAALAQVASTPVEQKVSPGNTATAAKDAGGTGDTAAAAAAAEESTAQNNAADNTTPAATPTPAPTPRRR